MKKTISVSLALMLCLMLSLGAFAEEAPLGTWEGTVFTSEAAGLTVTLPETWLALEGDMLAAILGAQEAEMEDDADLPGMMAMEMTTGSAVAMMLAEPEEGQSKEEFIAEFAAESGAEIAEGTQTQEITIGENVWTVIEISNEQIPAMYLVYRETETGIAAVMYIAAITAIPVEDFLAMLS